MTAVLPLGVQLIALRLPTPHTGAPKGRSMATPLPRRNHYHGGNRKIVGTVKKYNSPTNLPLVRKVILFQQRGMIPVAETWSDAQGRYQFLNLSEHVLYMVMAEDYEQHLRGVIANGIKAELMA